MNWSDEYLPLLLEVYYRKPEGVKPLYSRALVDLSLELHVHPRLLYSELAAIRRCQRPTVQRLLDKYSGSRRRLTRDVRRLRQMRGFGQGDAFFEGVGGEEPWEAEFRPVAEGSRFTPLALTLVLDLYFRLSPATMCTATPDVREAARRLDVSAQDVVGVMQTYMTFDPYLARRGHADATLTAPCRDIWQRHAGDDAEQLATLAAQMWEYYKK